MWELYLKGQEGANVKTCNEFSNDLIKMFLNTKQEWGWLKVVFLSCRLWFKWNFFVISFMKENAHSLFEYSWIFYFKHETFKFYQLFYKHVLKLPLYIAIIICLFYIPWICYKCCNFFSMCVIHWIKYTWRWMTCPQTLQEIQRWVPKGNNEKRKELGHTP
jgi:hypothetical protein